MKIPEFLDDLNIISKLGDNPGADNGLTAEGLKAKFDEGSLTVQQYINGVLIAKLNEIFAEGGQLNEGLIMTGPINMNQQMLFGLKNPVNESEPVSLGFAIANYAPKSHVDDTNNPHKVTASQVGARPNDWLPSIEDIGAAPGGYGLGEYIGAFPVLTTSEVNSALKTGWYRVSSGGTGTPLTGILHVESFDDNYYKQTLYGVTNGASVCRVKIGGTWGEWEAINPSMSVNAETRTTERYNGKTVFAKLVDFGAMPNATSKTVAYRGTGSTGVVSLTAMLSDGCCVSGGVCADKSFSNVDTFVLDSTKYNVRITTTTNWSSLSAYVLVKYTLD